MTETHAQSSCADAFSQIHLESEPFAQFETFFGINDGRATKPRAKLVELQEPEMLAIEQGLLDGRLDFDDLSKPMFESLFQGRTIPDPFMEKALRFLIGSGDISQRDAEIYLLYLTQTMKQAVIGEIYDLTQAGVSYIVVNVGHKLPGETADQARTREANIMNQQLGFVAARVEKYKRGLKVDVVFKLRNYVDDRYQGDDFQWIRTPVKGLPQYQPQRVLEEKSYQIKGSQVPMIELYSYMNSIEFVNRMNVFITDLNISIDGLNARSREDDFNKVFAKAKRLVDRWVREKVL